MVNTKIILTAFLSIILLSNLSVTAFALSSSQGPINPTVSITAGDSEQWSNLNNIISSDNSYATVSVDGTVSNTLSATNFGFSIPSNAVINGVIVDIERKSSSTSDGGSEDASLQLIKGGTISGSDRQTNTDYSTSDTTESHGTSSDLWGLTLTPADINAADFGVAFSVTKPSSSGSAHIISVDSIRITIHYSIPSSQGPSTPATATSSGSNQHWSNVSNSKTSDNSYATVSVDGNDSDYISATGFGFSIPSNAVINGVIVDVERKSSSTSDGGSDDASVRLIKGGSITGSDRQTNTDYTTSDTTESHGTSSDLWGLTLTPADINAANFGVAVSVQKNSNGGSAHTVSIDSIIITIHYSIVSSQGPSGSASVTSLGNDQPWSNIGNVLSSDNSYATVSVDGDDSDYISATGFGFSIPSDATITGIVVDVERKSSSTSNGGSDDESVKLIKDGLITGLDRQTDTEYTTSDVTESHGTSSDLWGLSLTPADINAANFGVAVSVQKSSSSGSSHTISIDNIKMTIHYTLPDTDGDGIANSADNCPSTSNADQTDTDLDGLGNACDVTPNGDSDGDGVDNLIDNCPSTSNADQLDTDGDLQGNACDAFPNDPNNDADADGISGDIDNCPTTSNADQLDTDSDLIGNACDPDDDNDGILDGDDSCPIDNTNTCDTTDSDGDGIADSLDNCPTVSNADQLDTDLDGKGNACDAFPNDPNNDSDGDGISGDIDNCPTVSNANQADSDEDGTGDACDADFDSDGDGVNNAIDNCPVTPNADQLDADGDLIGDACDTTPNGDSDSDGVDN